MSRARQRLGEALAARAILRLLRRLPAPGERAAGERAARDDRPGEPGPPPDLERELPSSRRFELVAVAALLCAALGGVAFAFLYVAEPSTQLLGLALGIGLLAMAVALMIAGRRIVPQEQAEEEREQLGDEALQREVAGIVRRGGEGITRRRMLLGAAGIAGVSLAGAAIVPVASLGPSVGDRLDATPWRAGRRLVTPEGEPLTPADVGIGTFRTAFPEGASHSRLGSPVIVVRLEPAELDLPPEREGTAPAGVLAFSKICPHAGCAISMYRHPRFEPAAPEPALVCPCHYSTFAVRTGGTVAFGPAGRALPQLPLALGGAGELVAAGGFIGGVGPSWRDVPREDEHS